MILLATSLPALPGSINAKAIVFLLGKCSLFLAVFLFHGIADTIRLARKFEPPRSANPETDTPVIGSKEAALTDFRVVTSRNIFGEEAKSTAPVAVSKPVTPLKLRLVGTQVPSQGRPYAIVEDTAKKKQDVFELNESVFDQAKLVAVEAEQIQIERNGKVEVLLMEDGAAGPPGEGGISSNSDNTEFTVAESELSDALANLPRLLSQARAVPYFRNGKSIGMRLFAIRRGSLYEKLGLKNGDIVLSVNNNSLNDPTQALKLFEQLKSERSINVELERGGTTSKLQYSIR